MFPKPRASHNRSAGGSVSSSRSTSPRGSEMGAKSPASAASRGAAGGAGNKPSPRAPRPQRLVDGEPSPKKQLEFDQEAKRAAGRKLTDDQEKLRLAGRVDLPKKAAIASSKARTQVRAAAVEKARGPKFFRRPRMPRPRFFRREGFWPGIVDAGLDIVGGWAGAMAAMTLLGLGAHKQYMKNKHLVVKGDTLWRISREQCSSSVAEMVFANDGVVQDPNLIFPGQELSCRMFFPDDEEEALIPSTLLGKAGPKRG